MHHRDLVVRDDRLFFSLVDRSKDADRFRALPSFSILGRRRRSRRRDFIIETAQDRSTVFRAGLDEFAVRRREFLLLFCRGKHSVTLMGRSPVLREPFEFE
jgi:hypothetical protein